MGEWRETEISYLKPNRSACAMCGHPIARRYWAAVIDGPEMMFCSPDHERLYHEYWVPLYGRKAVT